MKKIVSVSLEERLVESLDKSRGQISRSSYLESIIRGFLANEQRGYA